MATPAIGDKLLTPGDIKSSHRSAQQNASPKPTSMDDTVALSHAAPPEASPNEAIQSTEQARARLNELLGQLQSSPEQAIAAHGKPQQQGLLSA